MTKKKTPRRAPKLFIIRDPFRYNVGREKMRVVRVGDSASVYEDRDAYSYIDRSDYSFCSPEFQRSIPAAKRLQLWVKYPITVSIGPAPKPPAKRRAR